MTLYLTRKIVFEITYNVSNGKLNPTMPTIVKGSKTDSGNTDSGDTGQYGSQNASSDSALWGTPLPWWAWSSQHCHMALSNQ